MATARERAKAASEEALRKKAASPAASRAGTGKAPLSSSIAATARPSSSISSKASGSTISKPPTRPPVASTTSTTTTTRPKSSRADSDVEAKGDGPATGSTGPAAASRRTSTLNASVSAARPVKPSTNTTPTSAAAPRRPAATSRTAAASSTTTKAPPTPTAKKTPAPLSKPTKPVSDATKTPTSPAKHRPTPLTTKKTALTPSLTSPSHSTAPRSPPPKLSPVKELPALLPDTLPFRARAPSAIASESELEAPRKAHARARSVVVARPLTSGHEHDEDQALREYRIMNDFFKETKRRETLEEEILSLKEDLASSEARRVKDVEKVRTDMRREMDAAKRTAGGENELMGKMRERYEKQVRELQGELEGLRNRSSKLRGVESKIADVEAALQEKSEKEKNLRDDLSKESQDKKELARTIQDLKEEIDRAQKTLDEEGARQRAEKEKAVKVTEGLRKELEELKKGHGVERGTLDEKVKKAEALVEDLRKQLTDAHEGHAKTRATEQESAGSLATEHAAVKKELAEMKQALELAEKLSAERTRKHEGDLKNAQEEMQKAKSEHTSTISGLTTRNREAEASTAKLQAELDALRKTAENDKVALSQNEETSTNKIRELQDMVTTLQTKGSDGSKIVEGLQAELEALREANSSQNARQEADLKEMTSMTDKLQTELKQYELLSQKLRKEKDELVVSSRDDSTRLQDQNEQLQQQLDKLQSESSGKTREMQKTIARLEKESADLEAKHRETIQERSRSLDESANDREALQAEIRTLQDQVTAASADHEDAERLRKAHTDLNTQLEELKKQISTSSDENGKLVAQIASLESTAHSAKSESTKALESKEEELAALRTELSDAKMASEKVAAIEKQKAELEKTVADMDERAKDLAKQQADTQTRIDDLQKEHGKALESKETELASLRSSLEGNSDVAKKLAEAEDAKTSLQQQLEASKEEHARLLESKLGELRASHEQSIQAKNAEVAALKASVEGDKDLADQLAAAEKEKASLSKTATDLETQINNLRTDHEQTLESKLTDLRSQHTEALQNKARDLERLEQAANNNRDVAEKLAAAEQTKSALEQTVADLKAKVETLDDQHASAQQSKDAELNNLRKALDDSKSSLAKLSKLEAQLSDLTATHDSELDALRAQHVTQLESTRSSVTSTSTAQLKSLQSDNDALRSQVSSLREQIDMIIASHASDLATASSSQKAEIEGLGAALKQAQTTASETAQKLKTEHDAAIEELKLEGKMSLEEARQRFEDEAAGRVEAEVERALTRERTEHADELASVAAGSAEEMRALHAKLAAALREAEDAKEALGVERESAELREEGPNAEVAAEYEARVASLERELDMARGLARAAEERSVAASLAGLSGVDQEQVRAVAAEIGDVEEQLEQKTGLVRELSSRVADLEIEASGLRAENERLRLGGRNPLGIVDGNGAARPWSGGSGASYGTKAVERMDDPFTTVELGGGLDGMGMQNEYEVDEEGRTVEGTLASIQEQVRQLEELNEQIGQESARWKGNMDSARPSPSPAQAQ
ncbi:Chitin deacetylase [Sphaceloma murrayae]|uniref:Chitin deacetylase n=1 Tax=Sphaceloma murrayae TaxID=2082308 RepID=A0A2K1QJ30_9PEZI|nr:Chitin deacetylase [Sphaceloma murrayae]